MPKYQICEWNLFNVWLQSQSTLQYTYTNDTEITIDIDCCVLYVQKAQLQVKESTDHLDYVTFLIESPLKFKNKALKKEHESNVLEQFLEHMPQEIRLINNHCVFFGTMDHKATLEEHLVSIPQEIQIIEKMRNKVSFPKQIRQFLMNFEPIPVVTMQIGEKHLTLYYEEKVNDLLVTNKDYEENTNILRSYGKKIVMTENQQVWWCVVQKQKHENIYRFINEKGDFDVREGTCIVTLSHTPIRIHEGWEHLFIPHIIFKRNDWVKQHNRYCQIINIDKNKATIRLNYSNPMSNNGLQPIFHVPVQSLSPIEQKVIDPKIVLLQHERKFYLVFKEFNDKNHDYFIAYRILPSASKEKYYKEQMVINKEQVYTFPVDYETLIETKEYALAYKFLMARQKCKDNHDIWNTLHYEPKTPELHDGILLMALMQLHNKVQFIKAIDPAMIVQFDLNLIKNYFNFET